MAGSSGSALAIAVAKAGGLGSIPCGMLPPEKIRKEVAAFRGAIDAPINLNFFCHEPPRDFEAKQKAWLEKLAPYYREYGAEPSLSGAARAAFDDGLCALVEDIRPEIVSFHFGLPERSLVERVKKTGAKILSSATTLREAMWLQERGCDAIIAQGSEAGGHRGMFLEEDISSQAGTMALLPSIAKETGLPVIAAGGIANAQAITTSFNLGASAVQIGTAYLFCPESLISPLHRAALEKSDGTDTVITNIFSGRPARGIENRFIREFGAMRNDAPPFPMSSQPLTALRAAAEKAGSSDFSPLWSGQSAHISPRGMGAEDLTTHLAAGAIFR